MDTITMLIEKAKRDVSLLDYIESATGTDAKRYGKSTFIKPCPFCHKNKHHFSINEEGNYYNSFNNCVPGGTIIDFMMHYEHLSKEDAIKKLLEMANLTPEQEEKTMKSTKEKNVTKPVEKEIDFTDLIEQAHLKIQQTDYFVNRGLTSKTISKYKLGYAEEGFTFAIKNHSAIQEKENEFSKAYKYFLPIWNSEGRCSYFLTRIDDSLKTDKMHKIHNLKGRTMQLLNERYLQGIGQQDVIFVVEGYIDALSIEEVGYPAIALNSVVNANRFSELVKENEKALQNITFIVIPDGDEAGARLIENINTKLNDVNVKYELCELPGGYKDVNEFLVADRQGFEQFILGVANKAIASNKGDFLVNYLENFLTVVKENKINPISSQFKFMDDALGGGFFPGLYVLGGPTSVGKTAFVHQIADQVASTGIPVFYFSYEMSRIDLMARSLSRLSLLNDRNSAITDVEIKTGKALAQALALIQKDYHSIADNMEIYEGRFGESVAAIESKIQRLKKHHESFLVVVDYLQVVNASKTSLMGERSTVDAVVTRLKQISRDYQIPVIAISSFNRSNYNLPVSFESFKESGTIEYSADVLMGLQFRDIHQLANQKDEQKRREQVERWKKKYPRELELQILKNRFGDASSQMKFDYFTRYQFFREL